MNILQQDDTDDINDRNVFVNDRRCRLPLLLAQLWRGWGAVIIFDDFRIKMDEINRK